LQVKLALRFFIHHSLLFILVEGLVLKRREMLQSLGLVSGSLLANRSMAQNVAQEGFTQRFVSEDEAKLQEEFGVSSGEPATDALTLWTRVPSRFWVDGPVKVRWRLWGNVPERGTTALVREGDVFTSESVDGTLQVRVTELPAGGHFFYMFSLENGAWQSVQGLARTLPSSRKNLENICIAYVSCQYFGTGFYTVYQALARDKNVDFCVHLGDTIYEETGGLDTVARVRRDFNGVAISKEDYRARYRLALSDAHFREVRRLFTWICIPDDHEVKNDYSGIDISLAARRAAGLGAYSEYMPIFAGGFQMKTPSYRAFSFGKLATLFAMDLRISRDGQVCKKNNYAKTCDAALESHRTMLGPQQSLWLEKGLEKSESRWNVLLSQVLMMPQAVCHRPRDLEHSPLEGLLSHSPLMGSLDAWDGYPAERDRLCQWLKHGNRNHQKNTLVWSGDIHNLYSGYVGSAEEPAAFEVSTGSVTSFGVGDVFPLGSSRLIERHLRKINPHFAHVNLRSHMYVRCKLSFDQAIFESVCVDTIRSSESNARVGESIRVAWGTLASETKANF
jgi:alkaline phosphatase D